VVAAVVFSQECVSPFFVVPVAAEAVSHAKREAEAFQVEAAAVEL
jgi:hypothetical protein